MTLLNSLARLVKGPHGQGGSDAQGANPVLAELAADYEGEAQRYYAYLPSEVREIFVGDAIYHKARYLEMLARPYGDRVLELGSDKPFISHYLRELHPHSHFETVSIDIPFSKYPITRIDIESEVFPFEDASFSDVIFTEVLEHLFRDPAWAVFQINRVLRSNGALFLTTPNACGYDSLINLINQSNPNARSQFFAAVESGHPHLWTAAECRLLLEQHGFNVVSLDTADYVPIPKPPEIATFLSTYSSNKDLHGQSLRVVAHKVRTVKEPAYDVALFPEGKPVQLQGALLQWVEHTISRR